MDVFNFTKHYAVIHAFFEIIKWKEGGLFLLVPLVRVKDESETGLTSLEKEEQTWIGQIGAFEESHSYVFLSFAWSVDTLS